MEPTSTKPAPQTPPSVSVIVPFLNAETTIARCVRSIMSQSLDDFEVIFVNDGSRDNSFNILNEVLLEYPDAIERTHVLYYTYRQGVATAHRIGSSKATGRYIMRVDADDVLAPDALRNLVEAADRTQADIVMGNFRRIFPKKIKVGKIDAHFPEINEMKLVVDNYSMCNKIISRQLLVDNDIEVFPEIDCWDDLTLTARAFALSRRTVAIDEYVYDYYINPAVKSVSRYNRDTQLRQHLKAALWLEQWFVNRYPDNRYERFLDRLKLIAKVKYLRGPDKDVEAWKNAFPEVNSRILSISAVPLRFRLAMWTVAKLPTKFTQWIADHSRWMYRKEAP